MKIITEKTLTRLSRTRELCNQLPELFTAHDYNDLREKQISLLADAFRDNSYPHFHFSAYLKLAREESAFNLQNLKDEDFVMVAKIEPVTITKTIWNKDHFEEKNFEGQKHWYKLKEELEKFFVEVLD